MNIFHVTLLLLALTSSNLPAQPAAPPPQQNTDGPRNHRILLASSPDGLKWTVASESLAEQSSVPELFTGPDGKLIALFVDASGQASRGALGALVRGNDGKWTRAETNLRGADPNVVRVKDGTYRGYTKDRDGAIIVFSSRDGLDWERLGVAFQDERYRNSTDSDVFETPDGWVALISLGPRMLRCTSSDGLKFTTDGTILELGGSVSDTVAVKGGWRTFFHVNATPQTGGKMLIRSAFTADGKTWKVEPGDRVVAPSSGPASLGVADPAPAQLKDGSWLMAIKSFIERGGSSPQFAGTAGVPPAGSFGVPASAGRDSDELQRSTRTQARPPEGGTPNFAAAGARPQNPQPPGGGSSPREHEVHSATSKDGLTWTRDEGSRLMSASVPCVINDGDKRILLYVVRPPDEPGGVGGVSCAVSTDGTNFKIESAFRIEGLSTLTAADPSIVKDGDGKFRLYYLASNHRGDPAHGVNPHKINLALSDDGIRFREVGTAFEYNDLVDPDVFRFKGQWFMYVFARSGTVIATSADGKSFSYNSLMSPPHWGTVAPVQLSDGRLRLYAFEQRVPFANAVGSFISTDGLNWTAEAGQRLKANADEQITDPFVIPWRGGYKMYFKHSPARTRSVAANAPGNVGGQNNQRPDNQTGGRTIPPLPAGEGRGEGERRAQNFQTPNDFTPKPSPQNFNNADGPWNRDVIAHRVSASGAVEKAATFERAGVPTIARLKDGRLIVAHQHFPENDAASFDKVAVHFSSDDGKTWGAAQVIQVAGLPEGMRFPFDPTLVPLPDGRVRLYFTGNMGRTFGRSTPKIHSAISTDGVNYTYEPGARFEVEGKMTIDCAVALHAGVFHLFVPHNGAPPSPGQRPAEPSGEGLGYHATSKDGLNFTRVDDVQIEGRRRWLGNAESDGKLITFYGTGEGMSAGNAAGGRPRGAFWMATSADGKSWKLVANPPIGGGDPGAVKTRDGGLLVVITGESRVRPSGRRADFQPQQNFDNAGGPPALQSRRASSQPPSNPANDFEPPVGRDENSPRESPGHFRLLSARSSDGLTFVPTGQIISDQANVPDLIVGPGGAIHLYYSGGQVGNRENTLALAISTDRGASWIFKHVEIDGSGLEHAGDPDIVRLDDGTFRIFLTTMVNGSHGVIYCDSADGIHFTKRGTAFAKAGLELLDSTTFRLGSTWHTLTLEGTGTTQRHGTSSDGREFTVDEKMPFIADGEPYIAANGVAVDGGYRIYGFSLPARNFRSFITKDGRNWTAEKGVRLAFDDKSSLGGAQIKDPSVLRLADGSYLMVYVARLPEMRGGNVSSAARSRSTGGPAARREEEFGVPASAGRESDSSQRPARAEAGPPEGGTPNFNPPRREPSGQRGAGGQVRVEKIDSKYRAAPGAKPGSFVTGQDADLMLAGFGFNNTGGALHFNHPTGLATDGKALLMTDRWNNRVLIWKSAPAKNTPPDLVLGQPDFTQNNPGTGKHQMNWPGNVAITPDGKRIAVTDTDNDRILIWNSFPTKSGAAADVVLELARFSSGGAPASGPAGPRDDAERRFPNRPGGDEPRAQDFQQPQRSANERAEPEFGAPRGQRTGPEGGALKSNFRPQVGRGIQRFAWPWGVWTDGQKLAVVATHGSSVLIWNSMPTRDNQAPDLVLRPDDAGTPRNVTSDGKTFFALSDHNNSAASRPATMVWNSFPTSPTQQPDWKWSEWVKGSFTPDGKLVAGGMHTIYIWNKPPRDADTDADIVLRPPAYRNGDGPDAVVANGRFYACSYNGNTLLGWNSLPTRDNQPPDFSIGSDTPEQDVWAENFFIQNGVVATDGKSLFVSSDFNRKMFVWRKLPDENAAKPDLVFHLPEGPWDNELHGSTLVLAGKNTVYIWKKLPLQGEPPDATLSGSIGSVQLGEITGVAFDEKYFYLSDRRAETIYVWEGIPTRDSEPKFTLAMRSPGRLNSDGKYLCAAPFEGGGISLWRVNELNSRAEPITLGGRGQFNLPSECLIADGRLFVCNRSFNRVDVWNRVEDALAGRPADALLGATDEQDRKPEIGHNQLFGPGSLAWGGGYLWVGEFKFSTRILRFSPKAKQGAGAN